MDQADPFSSASPFLALSRELRDTIYNYAIDWPELDKVFKRIRRQQVHPETDASRPPLCMLPRPHFSDFGCLETPTILLLSHQITKEALEVLYQKPFVLASTPPYFLQLARPLDITEFISEPALQKLRFVELSPASGISDIRTWLKTIDVLLDVWCVKNELQEVVVKVEYVAPDTDTVWTFGEHAQHRHVMALLSRLRGLGSQVPVTFEGEMPDGTMVRRDARPGEWYDVID